MGFCQGVYVWGGLSWGRGVHLDFIERLFSTSERYHMNVGRYFLKGFFNINNPRKLCFY